MSIKVIAINKHLADCFIGDGWENWSRWFLYPNGYLKRIGGNDITNISKAVVLSTVRKELTK